MQSNQLVNFANEFDFLPDLARVAAAEVLRRWPGMGIAQAKALAAAGGAKAPALSPHPPRVLHRCPRPTGRRGLGGRPRPRSPAQGRPRARCFPALAGRCHTRPEFGSRRTLGRAGAPRGRRAPLRAAPATPQRVADRGGRRGWGRATGALAAARRPLRTGTESTLSPRGAFLPLRSPSQGESGFLSELGAPQGHPARNLKAQVSPRRCGDPSSPGTLRTNNGEELFQHPAPGTGFALFRSDFVGVSCTRPHRRS